MHWLSCRVVFLDSSASHPSLHSASCALQPLSWLHWSITITAHALTKHNSLWGLESISTYFPFQNTCHAIRKALFCGFHFGGVTLYTSKLSWSQFQTLSLSMHDSILPVSFTVTLMLQHWQQSSMMHNLFVIPHLHLSPYSFTMVHVVAYGWTMRITPPLASIEVAVFTLKCSQSVFPAVWSENPSFVSHLCVILDLFALSLSHEFLIRPHLRSQRHPPLLPRS